MLGFGQFCREWTMKSFRKANRFCLLYISEIVVVDFDLMFLCEHNTIFNNHLHFSCTKHKNNGQVI